MISLANVSVWALKSVTTLMPADEKVKF